VGHSHIKHNHPSLNDDDQTAEETSQAENTIEDHLSFHCQLNYSIFISTEALTH